MTPESLRELRETRGLTREELATELGCSASAIVQWELDKRSIPAWVEDKMLSNVKVTFPLTDLHELLDLAREEKMSFEDLLSQAIRELVAKRRKRSEIHGLNEPKPGELSTEPPPPPRNPAATHPRPKRKTGGGGSSSGLRHAADEHHKDEGFDGL